MVRLKVVPKTDLDYVEFYSTKLKENNFFFEQQRDLINSQIKASKELFLKLFGRGKVFKRNARKYLKERGII